MYLGECCNVSSTVLTAHVKFDRAYVSEIHLEVSADGATLCSTLMSIKWLRTAKIHSFFDHEIVSDERYKVDKRGSATVCENPTDESV